MRQYGPILAALALAPAAGRATELDILLRDQRGAPVADAIVVLSADAAITPPSQTTLVDQKNEAFTSLVSLLRPGDSIRFHNSDKVLHHVYSFARLNPFDVHVRPGETTAEVLYATAGLAAIGCNVHDDMLTYAFVTDRPFAAKTGSDGRARILDAPEGETRLAIWHPRQQAKDQTIEADIVISGTEQSLEFTIDMRPERRRVRAY